MTGSRRRGERAFRAASDAFERIRRTRPDLDMHLDTEHEHVDLALDVPAQPGLAFAVHLDLQNVDELRLCAGDFVLAWFPCTEPDRLEAFVDAVVQLLNGAYRILEYRRGSRVVRADLQAPDGDGWRRIGPCENASLIPWPPIRHTVLRNTDG